METWLKCISTFKNFNAKRQWSDFLRKTSQLSSFYFWGLVVKPWYRQCSRIFHCTNFIHRPAPLLWGFYERKDGEKENQGRRQVIRLATFFSLQLLCCLEYFDAILIKSDLNSLKMWFFLYHDKALEITQHLWPSSLYHHLQWLSHSYASYIVE